MKQRAFVDMDGVLADFAGRKEELGITSEEAKQLVGFYQSLAPLPDALDGVRSLIGMGYDVWIATKPPTGFPLAYADKVSWVLEHLPELKRKIIITHDKGLLGGRHDFLIDDRPHKANCKEFRGQLIHFQPGMEWAEIVPMMSATRNLEAP